LRFATTEKNDPEEKVARVKGGSTTRARVETATWNSLRKGGKGEEKTALEGWIFIAPKKRLKQGSEIETRIRGRKGSWKKHD